MARILVVDDDKAVRSFVTRSLEAHGHEVRGAEDGADACVCLENFRFDAMISDIRMPVMDGISLALKVKAEQPDLKVLLMTGFSNELARAHNISSLIDGILTKPFSIDVLNEAVRHLFRAERVLSAAHQARFQSVSSASHSGMSSSASRSSSD